MFWRSRDILEGPEWANVRALYKSSGYSEEELKKPIIGIVNSFNSICPGHAILKQMTQRVKEGIAAEGGMPVEFGTIGACDGIAMGHNGMKYVLPTREMIANDIEAMVEAHRLDGLVLLGSCDKIIPGMLIGAMRVNLPTVFVNGGPALPGHMVEGNPYGGEYIDHSFIQQSEGALKAGIINQEQFEWIENHAVPTIGSCAMLGTANTMSCLAEAMGIALPDSAAIPAVYSRRLSIAYESGKAVMELLKKGFHIKDIVTKKAIKNAIKVNSAIGGSTNVVLHLLALAYAAEIDLDIFEFGEVSKTIPHLVAMIPAGKYTLLDFYEAGGVSAIMNEIKEKLDLDCLTCTTKTVEENLVKAKNYNPDVIHSLDQPVHNREGIAILKGNLAPDGAVTKPSAIPDNALQFIGPAKIFESEQEALVGIRNHEVKAGDVVVIRNEGPKGGPGMPEMYKAMKLLVGMNLGDKVCVITDGRFSGSNNGCFVGHICPEAADNGPIAYLKNGDIILVDVVNGTIEALNVDFHERMNTDVISPINKEVSGYLYLYRNSVETASKGAIIPTRK
ncbi:dihydroxy-acid dehydratase [Tepidibacillus decaturensis]|uniref:Dihydroxy-acid dehydratase n=1 Tax=Tepidibacillus decaturensis TaxID=1413211 RepID=A0A135L5W9_9BACI|nr:dihydroxy-acid dehydratase [Tepidibacillus decaturensis]KXG44361.1 dihydroxy-acid dehydratase [Tepidibacillus decaturensis]